MNELLLSVNKYIENIEKMLAFVVGIFEKYNFM
ncbi:translation initiation factor, aIF-2BI, partial [Bacillus cereus]|nr:translation initiation factor, aIF-2BI [Bacillus cereus]